MYFLKYIYTSEINYISPPPFPAGFSKNVIQVDGRKIIFSCKNPVYSM